MRVDYSAAYRRVKALVDADFRIFPSERRKLTESFFALMYPACPEEELQRLLNTRKHSEEITAYAYELVTSCADLSRIYLDYLFIA